MIIDGNDLPNESKIECDVCILGGGVAGIVIANELKDSFAKVAIIESGGEEYTLESQELYAPETPPQLHPDPSYSRLRFLGGSSNHWQNSTSPLSKIDFEKRDWIPDSGWPIGFSDVSPYYQMAALYCGTGGDGYETDYWISQLGANDVLKGSHTLKAQVSKFSIPPVRFFHNYGASLNKSDNIEIYKNTNVVQVNFDQKSKKITVAHTLSNNGKLSSVHSRVFILCLGGIENARMLLAFNDKYENRLGNQGDSVGRYHMEHPTPRAAQFLTLDQEKFSFFEGKIIGSKRVSSFITLTEQALEKHQTTNLRIPLNPATNYRLSDGISSYHILGDSMGKGEIPENFGTHIYNLIGDLDELAEAVSRKKMNKRIFDSASEFGGFEMPSMMEQTPSRNNRIYLGNSSDRLGVRKPLIDWEITTDDKNRVWKSFEVMANEIGAMDLGRIKLRKEHAPRLWSDQLGFSNHHMGATRMAENPDTGVVDREQRVFGTDNFFISGSSVFATGGNVPPTLTIVALSIRLARHIEREYKNG